MSPTSTTRGDTPPAEPLYVISGSTYTIVSGTTPGEQPRYSPEDSSYTATKYISIIEKDHPLVAIWNSTLEDKMMGIGRLNDDWRTMNVLRRCQSMRSVDNPPVIFITVAKEASSPERWSVTAVIYKMGEVNPNFHTLLSGLTTDICRLRQWELSRSSGACRGGRNIPKLYDSETISRTITMTLHTSLLSTKSFRTLNSAWVTLFTC